MAIRPPPLFNCVLDSARSTPEPALVPNWPPLLSNVPRGNDCVAGCDHLAAVDERGRALIERQRADLYFIAHIIVTLVRITRL